MNLWAVKVIRAGTILSNTNASLHYQPAGEPVEMPIWIGALTDGVHKVLVDTGIGDDLAEIVAGPEPNCRQKPEEKTAAALKSATGWDPCDIDLIINTHLHFDHCGGNRLFEAPCCLQRAEWEAANHPKGATAYLYFKKYFGKETLSYFRWRFLNGETEILPGLIVFPTPGHTPGHQSVLINTERGSVCYAGDCAPNIENLRKNIEPSIVAVPELCYKSFDSIREKADMVIPGHEWRIANLEDKNFLDI
jgi:N-acyl homoserine lactone hydrolase